MRLVRYADDFVVVCKGDRRAVEALHGEIADVLGPVGLALSETKTTIAHIDEGFEFLGFRIQRLRYRGDSSRTIVLTRPSRKTLSGVMAKVKRLTGPNTMFLTLAEVLVRINRTIRGWAMYFRHGASKRTFSYLDEYVWRRILIWLRRRHPKRSWTYLRRRYLPGWRPTEDGIELFQTYSIAVTRYRVRWNIPTPWTPQTA